MTKLKNILLIAIMAICVVALSAPTTMARSSQVSIGSAEVDAGREFVIKVVFKGTNIGRVDAVLDYDKDHLEYVSGGTSNGDNGSVQLKLAGEGENIKFKLKFIAKKAGKTKLKISDSEIYDLDEQLMDPAHGTGTVTITGESVEDDASDSNQQEESQSDAQGESAGETGAGESDEVASIVTDEDAEEQDTMPWLLIAAAAIVAILLVVVIVMTSAKGKKR